MLTSVSTSRPALTLSAPVHLSLHCSQLRSSTSSCSHPGPWQSSACLAPRLGGLRPFAPSLLGSKTAPARQVVQQSFFGIGAPEAVLVGVVALVVFGPKGLAEAAKSVGSTLRSFQPSIREVVEASRDLRGTLEKELGLDEIRDISRPVSRLQQTDLSLGTPASSAASTASMMDPDIEEKRAKSAAAAWGASSSPPLTAEAVDSIATTAAATASKDLGSLSLADLEAELARRRSGASTAAGNGASSSSSGAGTA